MSKTIIDLRKTSEVPRLTPAVVSPYQAKRPVFVASGPWRRRLVTLWTLLVALTLLLLTGGYLLTWMWTP